VTNRQTETDRQTDRQTDRPRYTETCVTIGGIAFALQERFRLIMHCTFSKRLSKDQTKLPGQSIYCSLLWSLFKDAIRVYSGQHPVCIPRNRETPESNEHIYHNLSAADRCSRVNTHLTAKAISRRCGVGEHVPTL